MTNLGLETPLVDRCELLMQKFGFVAACKYHYHVSDIAKRLRTEGIETRIVTINERLFHLVLV